MLLSRAEGFSCSLEVLGGGLPLGIKFFILKNPELDSDPELAPDPDQIRIFNSLGLTGCQTRSTK